ncbi:MAG TPA: SCO family protein [Polyangiaceae bacterium]|nr:SCO family protein [Polyangiaceae bacterium]
MKIARFFAAWLCLGLFACARPESQSNTRTAPTAPSAPLAAPPPPLAAAATTEVGGASIYDLRVPLLDETGAVRPLDTFRGHPVLITMFYGSCPVACPILTSDLKRLEQQIPEAIRSDVRILMVSFDPERDTPAALTQLKQERGLNSHWTLASTGDDAARELAGVLDIKYRKVDGGAFYHTSVIVLLDRQGRPQVRLEGAGKDTSSILSALAAPSI